LPVKINAQVMMLNNDPAGRWVNGTMGQIIDIVHDQEFDVDILIVEIYGGELVEVTPYSWGMTRYFYDPTAKMIDSDVIGSFTQYPLRLSWAVTIHKSQCKTFDRVIVDIGRGAFSPGQVYVAISRATSLDGLVLKKPILKNHIWTDYKIVNFMCGFEYKESEKNQPLADKIAIIQKAIDNYDSLKITYLKPDNTKSEREIKPQFVGEMEFLGKKFIGVEAYCLERKAMRQFRVDRILAME
jgi:hypothetical protein